MPRNILCFGEALIDFHNEGQDSRGFPRSFVPFAGGAPANVAVAVARLGGAAAFAGMLGQDLFGDFLLDSLTEAGVDCSAVTRTDKAHTALAFVTLDAHGERSFSFYRPPSADLLFRPVHFQDESFRRAAVFHVCSNSMTDPDLAEATREGMRRARTAGALVSFDLNLRPALWPHDIDPRPLLWPALHLADLVKLSAEEFAYLAIDGEEAALEQLWKGQARLLVVTDGAKPLRWFHPDADGEMPIYSVPAVDSTAAGDAFVGGLLHRLSTLEAAPGTSSSERLDQLIGELPRLHATLRFAAACGALTVTRQGSFAAMPSETDALAFMDAYA
ncbi:carbohydrate kinase family protein [Dyella tabacisoli]|uniref:Carbohydrate kinase n=1 Tax=Dyella tabacisoli TaxID=2282381 RepID=A0A369UJL2_9GAMM|nr:carbohydrate kinase [Dyella tabacisoli]RDD80533.1 carbohydrate kinase [Dyella tabacisoli]